ncbi:MAG: F0F1 ATP synthase subunit A [Deltaproteobacteria bacterium]|nr:F0F1 ATP synthase subunit A [Deltaproteobacteria bacterium]
MHHILLPEFGLNVHTAVMIYLIIGLAILSFIVTRKLTIVPGQLQSIFELLIDAFLKLVDETMGHHGKKYFPIIMTFVLFIFFSNLMGLIPGMQPPTANLNSTLGFALVAFGFTHVIGVKEHGLKYFKSFIGPVWWLAPLMLPIEIIGHFARPLSLSLRLFGNIMGHEQIVGVLLILMTIPTLMAIAFPIILISTLLGIIVIFLQTFIFALLTMMYFGSAIEGGH